MKDREFLFTGKIFIIVISLALAGCTTTSQLPTLSREIDSSRSTAVISPIPPISTALPITPTPSQEPSLTPTSTVLPKSTPTRQPTATEAPPTISTPQGAEVTDQVLWLFETNNGCQLPCWWGITPGQTEWQTAQDLLSIFDSNIYETSAPSGLTYYGIRIPLTLEVFSADHMELGILAYDGVVAEIITDVSFGNTPPGYLTHYTLSTFLTTYGQPTEIWLFTYRSAFEEGDLPFAVALFYSEQGILALYSDNGERQSDLVQGCPQEDPVSFLSLWSPDLDLTFKQVTEGTSALDRDYLSLEEATEMDVATFYETFKSPDNTTCLETPVELWH